MKNELTRVARSIGNRRRRHDLNALRVPFAVTAYELDERIFFACSRAERDGNVGLVQRAIDGLVCSTIARFVSGAGSDVSVSANRRGIEPLAPSSPRTQSPFASCFAS